MAGLRVLGFLLVTFVFISGSLAIDQTYSRRCADKSVTPVSCANSKDGLMKHPDACNLYYYCNKPTSEPFCVECTYKQLFDAKNNRCDYEYKVKCDT